ncbi:hypothetical protein G7043_36445 [Lentzea sp. NEAU-D13]|uniref:Uncharacterized protein n=1 Tax=Lentzea alba TaxID=2714351 RepID=A0A7C9VX11_9PSEU|nr:hypothetical protein [Lentzea alba]NGY64415.1 hypothetical protein [Lentzea alba]
MSGLHCTMPNGETAPGKVLPAPPPVPWSAPPGLVPTNGFTHRARSCAAAAAGTAGTSARTIATTTRNAGPTRAVSTVEVAPACGRGDMRSCN